MLWLLALPALVIVALLGWSLHVSRRIVRMLPPDGKFAEVPGGEFHYVDLGPRGAPAIVMVHGLMGSIRNFTYAFATRMARDHRVIVLDRPGWGHSTFRGARPDVTEQARMIADLIARLGLEKPLLVGHSMGGAVSLALALSHPGSVRGLALIAPYTQPVDSPPEPFKGLAVPPWLRSLIAWTIAVPIAIRSGKLRSTQVFAPDPVPDDFGVKGGGILSARPASFLSGAYEVGIAKAAMEAQARRYGEIRLPVHILYGREDALLDPELHGTDTAAAIPGATVEMVEGGHMLPIAWPDVTENWLRCVAA